MLNRKKDASEDSGSNEGEEQEHIFPYAPCATKTRC